MSTTSAPGPAETRTARTAAAAGSHAAACTTASGDACVPQFRHFVRGCVRHHSLPDSTCDIACLVVSELVTNAVLHSGSRSVSVLVRIDPVDLLIAVRDCGCWRERTGSRRSEADAGIACGRGLALVRALTDFCTIESGPDGTLVTARLRLDGRARTGAAR
ncbi:ATP-binding protein [Kitasatospora sp. NPDC048365]|uniref:ATP-binding protein n=1 Tax=Kitasatospora sp. NPDC048365 TaxID=3364050 RepID=UPI00371BFC2C